MAPRISCHASTQLRPPSLFVVGDKTFLEIATLAETTELLLAVGDKTLGTLTLAICDTCNDLP
jgi:hypothetical protein